MTKTFTVPTISNQFDKFKGYISNPPEQKTLGWVLHYITTGNYVSILAKYGVGYLLIVLDLLESREEYEECAEVLKIIEDFNAKTKRTLPKHIRELKKVY